MISKNIFEIFGDISSSIPHLKFGEGAASVAAPLSLPLD